MGLGGREGEEQAGRERWRERWRKGGGRERWREEEREGKEGGLEGARAYGSVVHRFCLRLHSPCFHNGSGKRVQVIANLFLTNRNLEGVETGEEFDASRYLDREGPEM